MMNRKERRTAAKQIRTADIAGASAQTIDMIIAKAMADADAKKWAVAEKALRQVLESNPDHAEAAHQLGMMLARAGRATEGIDPLRRATELKPREALYWQNLAVCYSAIAKYSDAAEAARKAVEIDSAYGIAWDSLGDALMELKDFPGGRIAYEKSLALKGADVVTMKRLANCLMNAGELVIAEERLLEILALDPHDAEVQSNLGAVQLAQGRAQEAVVHLEAAAQKHGDRLMIAYNYARALAAVGDTEKALRWFRKATSIDHRAMGPWQHLGELQLQNGNLEEALVAAKRAVDMAPGHPSAADLLRRVQAAQNPLAGASIAPAAKQSPVMWDFHLGDGTAPAATPTADLMITFDNEPLNGVAAEAKKPTEKPAKPDPATGIVDLTVLKIG
nr:tetratricopeptide repeat protein [uncultured Dongia sp.]